MQNTTIVPVGELREGDILVYEKCSYNMRVVDVSAVFKGWKVCADYGNGGVPTTMFFDWDEEVLVKR